MWKWISQSQLVEARDREIVSLREQLDDTRAGADLAQRELGALRAENVMLQRDNARLANQMEMLIIQLATSNDERVALLRERGARVADPPSMSVEQPGPSATPRPAFVGRPLEDADEEERLRTLAAMESSSAASLFDDPGDTVAEALGRRHNEFGEVEHVQGR